MVMVGVDVVDVDGVTPIGVVIVNFALVHASTNVWSTN
jgi:hypothetical protein